MSREIDLEKKSFTEDEIRYLQSRGQLPKGVKPLDLSTERTALGDLPNTGDTNTFGLSTEELKAELKRRRAEELESIKAGRESEQESLRRESASVDADDDDEDEDDDEAPTPKKAVAKRA